MHLLEWIIVHPREDIHNLAHPLETYRRLHSSGTGLGTGLGTGTGTGLGTGLGTGTGTGLDLGLAAEGGKGPAPLVVARSHSHGGVAQGSTVARLPRRRAASVAPMSPVEHLTQQRPLTNPPASGSRASLSDAAASTADPSASASAAAATPRTSTASAAAAEAATAARFGFPRFSFAETGPVEGRQQPASQQHPPAPSSSRAEPPSWAAGSEDALAAAEAQRPEQQAEQLADGSASPTVWADDASPRLTLTLTLT